MYSYYVDCKYPGPGSMPDEELTDGAIDTCSKLVGVGAPTGL